MTLRCGCPNDGDPIAFGEVHECAKDPDLRYTRTGIEPVLRDPYDMDDDERRGY